MPYCLLLPYQWLPTLSEVSLLYSGHTTRCSPRDRGIDIFEALGMMRRCTSVAMHVHGSEHVAATRATILYIPLEFPPRQYNAMIERKGCVPSIALTPPAMEQ